MLFPWLYKGTLLFFLLKKNWGLPKMNKSTLSLLGVIVFLLVSQVVLAESADLDVELNDEDKAKFDQILQPVLKIYTFIKYVASVVAGLVLLWAGITYMVSGDNPQKREQGKNIAMYVVLGLIVIWAAPFIVDLLIA